MLYRNAPTRSLRLTGALLQVLGRIPTKWPRDVQTIVFASSKFLDFDVVPRASPVRLPDPLRPSAVTIRVTGRYRQSRLLASNGLAARLCHSGALAYAAHLARKYSQQTDGALYFLREGFPHESNAGSIRLTLQFVLLVAARIAPCNFALLLLALLREYVHIALRGRKRSRKAGPPLDLHMQLLGRRGAVEAF